MNYKINDFTFESSSKISKIYGKTFIPENKNYKGVIQLIHGMCEYTDKYLPFIEYLLKNNFIVVMHDQLGHGNSISDESLRGYFGEKNGAKYLVEDAVYVMNQTKNLYPNLPYFIFGHSMGSFITRIIASKYGDILDGIILCGTGGPNPLYKTGVDITKRLIQKHGSKYKSIFLTELACKFFNTGIKNATRLYDWTTRDEEIVKARDNDKMSNFVFTTGGYKDLFTLVKTANDKSKFEDTSKGLHIFIISGEKDPVGANTLGVRKVYNTYQNNGVIDVNLKIYPRARHELLSELNKKEIFKDINNWLANTLDVIEFNDEPAFTLADNVIKDVMAKAAELAIDGVKNDIGGPFGAAVIQLINKEPKEKYTEKDVKVISVARNTVISSKDATCHAEVNALREASKKLDRFDLSDCILLTTGKSCPMCIAAAYWSKIPVVYYACDYDEAEEAGFDDREISNYISHIRGRYSLTEIKKYESIGKSVFKVWNEKNEKTQY